MAWTKEPDVVRSANKIGEILCTLLRIQSLDKLARAQRLLQAQQLKNKERSRDVGEAATNASAGSNDGRADNLDGA
jgi:hypothetical protein